MDAGDRAEFHADSQTAEKAVAALPFQGAV
jgi:hypothetical protein